MNALGIPLAQMCLMVFFILLMPELVPAATYEQDFNSYPNGTTDLRDGTVIIGSSASVQNGRLQLTRDRGISGFASFSIPALEGSSLGFRASFDIELNDSINFNPPADGFSFNYGNAPMGDRGAAEEGMRTRPAVTENLSFEVDTWMNGDPEQGVNISGLSNGLDVGQLAFTNGIILNDGQRVSGAIEVEWDPASGASFRTTGLQTCLLYTSPSPRDRTRSRMPSSA